MDFIKAHHPSAQQVTFETGHIPSLEEPEAFNQSQLKFLSNSTGS